MRGLGRLAAILAIAPIILAAGSPPTWGRRWAISVDDYPSKARQAQLQGTARFELAVDEAGSPTKCAVIKSSGHQILDDTTCQLVMKRAKFKPARDAAGNAVPGVFRHLIVWELGTVPTSQPAYAGHAVTVTFDSAGAATSCEVVSLVKDRALSAGEAAKCKKMANADVFSALLGRPTTGLAEASYRYWLKDRRFGGQLPTNQPVRRLLAHVEFDTTHDDAITWCEIVVPPASPAAGLGNVDLCGPKAYGVTRAGGGGQANDMFVDVVAIEARGGR